MSEIDKALHEHLSLLEWAIHPAKGFINSWIHQDIKEAYLQNGATEEEASEAMVETYTFLLDSLSRGETYQVESEWLELLGYASSTLPPSPPIIEPSDIMSQAGFVWFENSLMVSLNDPEEWGQAAIPWRGLTWSVEEGKGVVVYVFVDTSFIGDVSEDRATSLPLNLTLFHFDIWPFGERGVETDLTNFQVDTRKVIYAFWQLARDFVRVERPSRGARRRQARVMGDNAPEVSEVRHITLRRYLPGVTPGEGETSPYSHRFPVRGHWRNQWFPSLGSHRPIWINPYVKGPEDKPLIRKHRIFHGKR